MSPAIRARSRIHRGKMNRGGQAFTGQASISKSLKDRIQQHDKHLELHHFGDDRVHMYRIKTYGASPSSDLLIHQFVLKYPPGEWLMDCLYECDKWTQYGSIERATRKQMEEYEDVSAVAEREAMLRVSEVSEALAPDLIKYVERKRVGVLMGRRGPAFLGQ